MRLELVVEDSADPRYYVNVLDGVADPRNPNGDGDEIDIFGAMNEAIYKIPAAPEAIQSETPWNRTAKIERSEAGSAIVWRADAGALNMMKRQMPAAKDHRVAPQDIERLPFDSYRGIPIREIHG